MIMIREVIEVAQEGRGPHERVEVLCVPDVAGVHDDELPARPPLRAHALSFSCGESRSVSTQFGITRTRSGGAPFSSSRWRIVSPIATMRSARRR